MTRPEVRPGCLVLVVEDDPDVRETLELILTSFGCDVATAANGREALALLARPRLPCVILLDLMMPVMNGWEFLDARQKLDAARDVPVVVVTAFAERLGPTAAARVAGVITKPVEIALLRETVARHCGPG